MKTAQSMCWWGEPVLNTNNAYATMLVGQLAVAAGGLGAIGVWKIATIVLVLLRA